MSDTVTPVSDGSGRTPAGKFAKGNKLSRGNPMARRVNRLRVQLLRTVGPDDIAGLLTKLIELGHDGNVVAIREVFDRCLGQPLAADILDRIEKLEQHFLETTDEKPNHGN